MFSNRSSSLPLGQPRGRLLSVCGLQRRECVWEVSGGSPADGSLDSGVGGGICVECGEEIDSSHHGEETEGEDTWKHYNHTHGHRRRHIFTCSIDIFLLLPQPREKACQDRAVGLALLQEWRGYNFIASLRINFCVISFLLCFLEESGGGQVGARDDCGVASPFSSPFSLTFAQDSWGGGNGGE